MAIPERSPITRQQDGLRESWRRAWRIVWRALLGAALAVPALALAPGAPALADGTCTTSGSQVACTFAYTGAAQTWTLPAGATQATFDVYGASGGNVDTFTYGGRGGEAVAALENLATGETVSIYVGGQGGNTSGCVGTSGGGFNGGAAGGGGFFCGTGGGGASDVRVGGTALADRVLVAGGGGGAANISFASGGAGGGPTGGAGVCTPGGCTGGSGGNQDGTSGSGQQGTGSAGAAGDANEFGNAGGGGGGGGYYGGAGGSQNQGGGGGSGFGPTGVVFQSGVQPGNGKVVITYTLPDTTPPTASPTQTPAAITAGWNNTDVTVAWNWADNPGGSGIDPNHCTQSSTSSGEGTITLTATCDDLAGNQGSASYTVKVDKTAPSIIAAATIQPNAGGWYTAPVTIHFTCSNALSGIPSGACPADQVLSTDGNAVSSTAETVTDLAGNRSSPSNVVTVKLDQTPPTISASATKADGSAYMAGTWTNQAVTVHYTCADATSGVATCPADQTFGTEGANQTASGTATDAAGNRASASYGPIQIDKTPPTIVAATTSQPNANGWYNGNVTIHFTCADNTGGSGIPAGACPVDQTLSAEGSAVSSTAETVSDAAGNQSALSNVVKVAIDKTPPVVTVTGVANGATYPFGAVPAAGCSTTDTLSGVATNATLTLTGGNADGVGTFTATCAGAQDRAGNAAPPVSATYTVGYQFSGFLAPVQNPPTINTGHAGRTYPVKFQLTNATGASISTLTAVQSITYQATACGAFASAPTDALTTTATGGTSLRYDSTANQFIYNWKTPTTAGCYTLFLTLDSGQVFPAAFNLR